uniref:hypothetical protein n=1 Tax=Oricola nitratireducens TaxID=2775868 RepID=UPI001AED4F2B
GAKPEDDGMGRLGHNLDIPRDDHDQVPEKKVGKFSRFRATGQRFYHPGSIDVVPCLFDSIDAWQDPS